MKLIPAKKSWNQSWVSQFNTSPLPMEVQVRPLDQLSNIVNLPVRSEVSLGESIRRPLIVLPSQG